MHNGSNEEAIKCVKVDGGVDTCTVAFVPRVFKNVEHVRNHAFKFVQATKLYSQSKTMYKQSQSESKFGVAKVELLLETSSNE